MIKYFILPILAFSSVNAASYQNTAVSDRGQSRMHHMQQKHPDRLSVDERRVYYMLSPLYQRVYLYALDDDQREMVTVFERRGENPYSAIDNILKRDRKRSDKSYNGNCSPCDRTRRSGEQKKYIISERGRNRPEYNSCETYKDEDYALYEGDTVASSSKQSEYQEKERYARNRDADVSTSRDCDSCCSARAQYRSERNAAEVTQRRQIVQKTQNVQKAHKKPKKRSAFVARCRAYFSKSDTKKASKSSEFKGNANWQKHKYEGSGGCKCNKCKR